MVLELIAEAREAGLSLRVEGEKLIVRGPRRHERLATALLERKPDVIAALSVSSAPLPRRMNEPANRGQAHRLTGCGFPGRLSETPNPCIIATAIINCPRCRHRRLLPELRRMCGELCYTCWSIHRESQP